MNTIKQKILNQINTGTVTMRPRWQFIVQSILLVIGVFIISLTCIYVFSLVAFILVMTDVLYTPTFGVRGVLPFLLSLPWILLSLGLVFVIVLEFLVRQFSFAYQRPLLYSVLGIVFLMSVGSYAVVWTTLHDQINKTNAPFIGTMYKGYSTRPPRDLYIGTVADITPIQFTLDDKRRGMVIIMRSNHHQSVGDVIMVFGQRNQNGGIIAKDIRPITTEQNRIIPPQLQAPAHSQIQQ